MIDLAPDQLRTVRRIVRLFVPECEVRVFGSRVTGTARRHSDLDLAVVGPTALDWRRLEALRDAFSSSDLPFLVDVVDWHAVSPEFRRRIEANYLALQDAAERDDAGTTRGAPSAATRTVPAEPLGNAPSGVVGSRPERARERIP